tara:strand:+ start:284 stop:1132 length:849 start_codon:yes stop_codon:yes gene_type:complete
MKFVTKASRLFFPLCLLFILGACSEYRSIEVADEEDEPTYRRAKQLISRGKNAEALESFLKLIQAREGDAPESHLEAGRLYLNHIEDPYSAIYHFNRFKSMMSSRANVPSVKQKLSFVEDLKKTAMKGIMSSFDAKVFQDPLERLKLLDTIDQLRTENDGIKMALGQARQRLREAGIEPDRSIGQVSSESVEETESRFVDSVEPARLPHRERPNRVAPAQAESSLETSSSVTYYVVKKGDTLASISRKFYGTSARYREILKANRSVTAENLQIGTSLVIPKD